MIYKTCNTFVGRLKIMFGTFLNNKQINCMDLSIDLFGVKVISVYSFECNCLNLFDSLFLDVSTKLNFFENAI